jgi:TMEM175 potassium channel family protein
VEKGRLEAFSDAVIAILITVMVLELRVPEHDASLGALRDVYPVFLTYVLSFVYLGIYWNNHHHLLQSSRRVTGGVLWANLHLLFWLSLFPFATGWMGQNHFERTPTIAYGVVLLAAAIAYFVLQRVLVAAQHDDSLAIALGSDVKGKVSPFIYVAGMAAAFLSPWISEALYVLVAVMWLVPDRRLEPHEEAQD